MAKKKNKSKSSPKTKVVVKKDESIDEAKEVAEKKGLFAGFMSFLKQYSVLGLAIGLVIGSSTQNLVKNIVDGIITPILTLVLRVFFPQLQSLNSFAPEVYGTPFKIGAIIQSLIEFVILLFLIYVIVGIILRRDDLIEKKDKKK